MTFRGLLFKLAALAAIAAWTRAPTVARLVHKLTPTYGFPRALLFGVLHRKIYRGAMDDARRLVASSSTVTTRASFVFERRRSDRGILFLPGAGIEADAYALLLRDVSLECDATVVAVRPPLRCAILTTESEVRRQMRRYSYVRKWMIAGHSLGAKAAANLAAKMVVASERDERAPMSTEATSEATTTTTQVPRVAGLCMLASSMDPHTAAALASARAERPFPCCAIFASRDHLVPPNESRAYPRWFHVKAIQGGDHAGFGSYTEERKLGTLSRAEQQRLCVRTIGSWWGT